MRRDNLIVSILFTSNRGIELQHNVNAGEKYVQRNT